MDLGPNRKAAEPRRFDGLLGHAQRGVGETLGRAIVRALSVPGGGALPADDRILTGPARVTLK